MQPPDVILVSCKDADFCRPIGLPVRVVPERLPVYRNQYGMPPVVVPDRPQARRRDVVESDQGSNEATEAGLAM